MSRVALAVLAGLIGGYSVFGTGCGSTDPGPSSGGSAGTHNHACSAPDVYTAGAKKAGEMKLVEVTLQETSPSVAIIGDNTWTLSVTDANAAPIDGATLLIKGTMPEHDHPSPRTPIVTAKGGGIYEVSKVSFTMGGLWQMDVNVAMGELADRATFEFCVDE